MVDAIPATIFIGNGKGRMACWPAIICLVTKVVRGYVQREGLSNLLKVKLFW